MSVELRTSPTYGDHETRDGTVEVPADYLPRAQIGFHPIGVPIRLMEIHVGVLAQGIVNRILDQSVGSEERALMKRLFAQERVICHWVNEGVVTEHPIDERYREWRRSALEQTEQLSAEQWREEVAEHEWKASDNYVPGQPPPPRRPRPGRASPPEGVALAFFATQPRAVPKARNAEIAGVRLPEGLRLPSRAPAYWITTGPVANLELLAPWLVEQYPATGLWPLIWRPEDQDPDDYGGPVEDIDSIDGGDLLIELCPTDRYSTEDEDLPAPLLDLAPAQPGDPSSESPFPGWALRAPARLLLIPCHRPADSIAVIGGVSGEHSPTFISAMLRSWEQRYGATIIELAPGMTRVSVSRPPTDPDQSQQLAAEIQACHITGDQITTQPLEDIADDLQHGERDTNLPISLPQVTRDCWDIIW